MDMRLASMVVLSAMGLWACGGGDSTVFSTGTTASSGSGGSGGEVAATSSGTGGAGGAGGGSTTTSTSATSGTGGSGQGGSGEGGSSGQGGSGAPVCASPGDPCNDCMFQQCNTTFCDCASNPSCLALGSCLGQCAAMDQACQNNCFAADSAGLSELAQLGDCSATTCSASCNNPAPVDPCQLCLATHCETELEACFGNSECVALIGCASACPPNDSACVQACAFQHLGGAQAGQALATCSTNNCSAMCGG